MSEKTQKTNFRFLDNFKEKVSRGELSFPNENLDKEQKRKIYRIHRDVQFTLNQIEEKFFERDFLEAAHMIRYLYDATRILIFELHSSEKGDEIDKVYFFEQENSLKQIDKVVKLRTYIKNELYKSEYVKGKFPLLFNEIQVLDMINPYMHYNADWNKIHGKDANDKKDKASTYYEHNNKIRIAVPGYDELLKILKYFHELYLWVYDTKYSCDATKVEEFNEKIYIDVIDKNGALSTNYFIKKCIDSKCPICKVGDINPKPCPKVPANKFRVYLNCMNPHCNSKVDDTLILKKDISECSFCKKSEGKNTLQIRLNLASEKWFESFKLHCYICSNEINLKNEDLHNGEDLVEKFKREVSKKTIT